MNARPHPVWTSPALVARPAGDTPAYETKFLVSEPDAARLEAWAATALARDPHGDPARDHRYRVTSLYFDTPGYDICRRTDGFRRHKYRVRRYGIEPTAHLERKSKRDGRVWKVRTAVPLAGLRELADDPGPAAWFLQHIAARGMGPVARVSYDRTAFVGAAQTGPIRLTFDRAAVGEPVAEWAAEPVASGPTLLDCEVIVEFKYLIALPAVFKERIEALRLVPSSVSKYRRLAAAVGLVTEGTADA